MRKFRNTPYTVSVDGHVCRDGSIMALTADVSPKGYRRVTLSIDGKTERFLVHRMVAEVYLVKKPEHTEVNHKDGIPGNDWKDNLEWVTKSENQLHAINMGNAAHLTASKAASASKFIATEAYFKNKLGTQFIRVVNKSPRNYVEYYCANCKKELLSRSDSCIFNKDVVVCRSCG